MYQACIVFFLDLPQRGSKWNCSFGMQKLKLFVPNVFHVSLIHLGTCYEPLSRKKYMPMFPPRSMNLNKILTLTFILSTLGVSYSKLISWAILKITFGDHKITGALLWDYSHKPVCWVLPSFEWAGDRDLHNLYCRCIWMYVLCISRTS